MTRQPVTVLDEQECWELISGLSLGRLVTIVDGRPEVFPVNFVVQDKTVLFRTGEGTKLLSTVLNNQVVFEVDDHNVIEGWSVVVRGTARQLRGSVEVAAAEEAGLFPWIATTKPYFVRIEPNEISGRGFIFGSEPDHTAEPS